MQDSRNEPAPHTNTKVTKGTVIAIPGEETAVLSEPARKYKTNIAGEARPVDGGGTTS